MWPHRERQWCGRGSGALRSLSPSLVSWSHGPGATAVPSQMRRWRTESSESPQTRPSPCPPLPPPRTDGVVTRPWLGDWRSDQQLLISVRLSRGVRGAAGRCWPRGRGPAPMGKVGPLQRAAVVRVAARPRPRWPHGTLPGVPAPSHLKGSMIVTCCGSTRGSG